MIKFFDEVSNLFGGKSKKAVKPAPGKGRPRPSAPAKNSTAQTADAKRRVSERVDQLVENRRQEQGLSSHPKSSSQGNITRVSSGDEEATNMAESRTASTPESGEAVVTKDSGRKLVFEGTVLTAAGGPLKIAPESRNLCALFDNGLWLVSASHKNSPLVTSVALTAKRQGFKIGEPVYVTPDRIREAYHFADRQVASARLDDNSIRRKIVETLLKAREAGANDIHIEASGSRTKVEFRIDGALRLWETWTQKEGEQFLSAVFSHSSVQSGATANWLEPQAAMLVPSGGSDSIALPEGIISVRCQWMPLADGGRYLDMRLQYDNLYIFGEGFMAADVDSLGFSPEQTELVRILRYTPGCIRCITGPVNQGKTTTLRVVLNRRMAETNGQLNCLMIEDPPEGGVIGARQIGVSATVNDEQRERTFIGIMRAALRLDPDIVMLGETRDLQSANFLFRLALTGRQVYTTLHVYSALAVPQRLRDIGIEPYLVYDHHLMRGMMCQRLMRGLCRHCRLPIMDAARVDPKTEQLARRVRGAAAMMHAERKFAESRTQTFEQLSEPDLRGVFVENPDGCRHCYKGRVGRTVAAEVIEADAKLMGMLEQHNIDDARAYWLSPHGLSGLTMAQHALSKVLRGEVSPYDAEFEMGLLIRERELQEVEKVIGTFRGPSRIMMAAADYTGQEN